MLLAEKLKNLQRNLSIFKGVAKPFFLLTMNLN